MVMVKGRAKAKLRRQDQGEGN